MVRTYWNGLWIMQMLTENHEHIRHMLWHRVRVGIDEGTETKDGRVSTDNQGHILANFRRIFFRFFGAKFHANFGRKWFLWMKTKYYLNIFFCLKKVIRQISANGRKHEYLGLIRLDYYSRHSSKIQVFNLTPSQISDHYLIYYSTPNNGRIPIIFQIAKRGRVIRQSLLFEVMIWMVGYSGPHSIKCSHFY